MKHAQTKAVIDFVKLQLSNIYFGMWEFTYGNWFLLIIKFFYYYSGIMDNAVKGLSEQYEIIKQNIFEVEIERNLTFLEVEVR